MENFVTKLDVNIVALNYLVNGMLLNIIKNLYVPFGIPFGPKRYYKDGGCTRMLRRPRYVFFTLFELGKLVSKIGYDVLDMALPPRDQRHHYLRSEGLEYTDADITDFEERLGRIYGREIHRVQVFNFGGLTELTDKGLSSRMLMEHKDDQGQGVFTSRDWRKLFEIRGPLFQLGKVRRRMSWREFMLGMGLHIAEEIESVGFSTYWAESAIQIPDKGDLSAYWIGILYAGDFLGTAPSYTSIRDPMLRLCHRLIACSIAGRSQAPEKVIMTDLFYLMGMDVGSSNIPYLLARYLRLFAKGRKRGAMIFGGQFVARLAEHFGLLTEERLQGLMVVTAGTPVMTEDALVVDEGAPTVPAPVQAPQAPPAAGPTSTITQRLGRLKEDVHGLRGALGEQKEVLDNMACDFSQFTTWMVIGLSRMMDQAGVRIKPDIIMEYLVKISKKARILELKRRHLKITVLTSYTPYPSRKIRRICACTSLKTTKEQGSIRRLRKKYRLSLKNDMPPRDKDPLYQRLAHHPIHVQTFLEPILYISSIAEWWARSPSEPIIMRNGERITLRNFVVAGNNKDMSFIVKSKNEESFDIGFPSVSVNNNDVDAAPSQPRPVAFAPLMTSNNV
ncbi:hypothetical protein Tco_1245074 [Tanacetum coccineum]